MKQREVVQKKKNLKYKRNTELMSEMCQYHRDSPAMLQREERAHEQQYATMWDTWRTYRKIGYVNGEWLFQFKMSD